MKKLKLMMYCSFLIFFFKMNAQVSDIPVMKYGTKEENKTLEFITFSDELSYQLNIFSVNTSAFSSSMSFRFEEELYADETYVLWQEVNFLDLNLSYTIGALSFAMDAENILNFNNRDFAIEPDLMNNNVAFIQENNFLISASVVYNF